MVRRKSDCSDLKHAEANLDTGQGIPLVGTIKVTSGSSRKVNFLKPERLLTFLGVGGANILVE
jgi:hypothetical protein